jgi:hypothetical protein
VDLVAVADVDGRIGVEDDEVGELAGLQRADVPLIAVARSPA